MNQASVADCGRRVSAREVVSLAHSRVQSVAYLMCLSLRRSIDSCESIWDNPSRIYSSLLSADAADMKVDGMRLNSDHPLREELHNELHARPSLYFDGDADVWHVAILDKCGSPSLPKVITALKDASSTQQGKHGIASYADGRLKWELHTEFLTLTFVISTTKCTAEPPYQFLELCNLVGGQVIAAVRVRVRDDKGVKQLERPQPDFVASQVGGGDAEVHSNFRLDANGFVEFLFFNRNLNAYRTGRMVRRLLEIETYRMMALLAVPIVRETDLRLAEFDQRLTQLVGHMQNAEKVDKALLSEVTKLSSNVLNFSALARHRFSATQAYAEIVASRLRELREEHVVQRQRIGTFIDRRFQPAVRSFRAAERRLDELAERVGLAGDLLRTTVQVQLEDQNASLLSSMEERARVQVQIQQAVEGFSVIAITYYVVGLAKLLLEGAAGVGLDSHYVKIAILAMTPFVLFAVWMTVRKVRKSIVGIGAPQAHAR